MQNLQNCTEQLVVTMTVENGKWYETDHLDITVDCVDSPTGQCPCPCDRFSDANCSCKDIKDPIRIGVTKTPVNVLYPLERPTIFNGRPHEVSDRPLGKVPSRLHQSKRSVSYVQEYIPTGAGTHLSDCEDGQFHSEPTCGWAKTLDSFGNPVDVGYVSSVSLRQWYILLPLNFGLLSSESSYFEPTHRDSQGFCCRCPIFGGEKIPRGYRDCTYSLSWLTEGTPSSAHCLKYDDNWWYRGYKIGQYQIDFEVQIIIRKYSIGSESNESLALEETLAVSPSETLQRSQSADIMVELVGDYDSYAEIESLRDHWLMIPVQPGLSPNEIFSTNLDMWMVLPPSKVSTTGECNKVGVSYAAFKFQGSDPCSQPLGSCLQHQIYDFEIEDETRLKNGLAPLYNIQRYGGGLNNKGQVKSDDSALMLKLPLIQMRNSVIVLSMNAKDVQYVAHVGHGVITSSSICDYSGKTCDAFEAISGIGYLKIWINNTVPGDALIHVSVVNCCDAVVPVLQSSAAVRGFQEMSFSFEIKASTDVSTNCSCEIVVKNSLSQVTDSESVEFSITSTRYSPQPEQSDNSKKV